MYSEGSKKPGCIEVVCGSMFSGKTEELIRRLRRAQFANQKIAIFKPAIDRRYSDVEVVSHDFHKIESTPVSSPSEILDLPGDVQVVGIDEAQFFDESLVDVCQPLANRGVRVIVAGLDTDFKAVPFGPIPMLMAVAAAKNGAVFRETRRLKIKESDRGAAMAEELAKFGVSVTVHEDSIVVYPVNFHAPKEILHGHNDHRIVMALSTLLTITGGEIDGAEAVRKSLPEYFELLKSLGAEVTEYET